MISMTMSQVILYFTLYSFIGWVCETTYCSIAAKRFVNRGFLSGPYCPIYGFGAIFILYATARFVAQPVVVFLLSMVLTAALEYFTSWLLEKLFNMRWWDYSGRRFNLHGRICLTNTLIFGAFGLLAVYVLHPLLASFLGLFQPQTQRVLSSLVIVLLFLDLVRSLSAITGIKAKLDSLYADVKALDWGEHAAHLFNLADIRGSVARLRARVEEDGEKTTDDKRLASIDAVLVRMDGLSRVLKAYPQLLTRKFVPPHKETAEEKNDRRDARREWFVTLRHNAVAEIKSSYEGVTFTRMVWVFLIACVIGFVVETITCVVTRGVIESRQGMLYGPFNQVYGFGALFMVLLLLPFERKGPVWLFVGSMVIGGLFEVGCSYVQEFFLHTRSWNYSDEFLSFFGGRTSIKFMLFWGILGTFYIHSIYPRMIAVVDRIQPRPKAALTILITITMILNLSLSAVAVRRWSQRQYGVPQTTAMDRFLDRHYPNDVMREIYPNMLLQEDQASRYADKIETP